MTMDLHNAPFRRPPTTSTENEYKDPAAWFRPDPDVWLPPTTFHDPDVFAPPIDRCVISMIIYLIFVNIVPLSTENNANLKKKLQYLGDHNNVQAQIENQIIAKVHNQNLRQLRREQKKAVPQVNQTQHERDQLLTETLNLVMEKMKNTKSWIHLMKRRNSRQPITWRVTWLIFLVNFITQTHSHGNS